MPGEAIAWTDSWRHYMVPSRPPDGASIGDINWQRIGCQCRFSRLFGILQLGGEIDQKVETLFSEGPDGEKDQLAIPFWFAEHLDLVQSGSASDQNFREGQDIV